MYFADNVYQHGWSNPSDLTTKTLEWDDSNDYKDVDVKFQVKDVSKANVRIVARDRKCHDKNKTGCKFDKEVLGVTELISTREGSELMEYPLESYYHFDASDKIVKSDGLRLLVDLKIDQRGYLVRHNKESLFAWPYTRRFRDHDIGWSNLVHIGGTGSCKSPTNGVPKILKQICLVKLNDKNVELNLAVSCLKDNGGVVRFIPMSSSSSSSSSRKSSDVAQYVGLFETETSRMNEKASYDSKMCFVKTNRKVSETCLEIDLVWNAKKFTRFYVQIFDGSRVGVYEKLDSENRMITRVELKNDKTELFGVE